MTLNLNGIRSAAKKGFFEWLAGQDADIVCLQETRAQLDALDRTPFCPAGYHCYFYDAAKPGYSGVGIYSRREPRRVTRGFGWAMADVEARSLQLDFDGLSVVSLYVPSGSSGEPRQRVKFAFMEAYFEHLKKLARARREVVICGDWNIVHKEIDIKNWKANQQSSGCLPEERAWLDRVFTELEFVDAFRVVNHEAEQYTWWSHRGRAWEKNVGWRIDYQVVTPGLRDKIQAAHIYKARRFSDHAPLIVDYARLP